MAPTNASVAMSVEDSEDASMMPCLKLRSGWAWALLLLCAVGAVLSPWAPWVGRWHALWGYLLLALGCVLTLVLTPKSPTSPPTLCPLLSLSAVWILLTDAAFAGALSTQPIALCLAVATLMIADSWLNVIGMCGFIVLEEVALTVVRTLPPGATRWAPTVPAPPPAVVWGGLALFLLTFVGVVCMAMWARRALDEANWDKDALGEDCEALVTRLAAERVVTKRLLRNLLPADMAGEAYEFMQGHGNGATASPLVTQRFMACTHDFATVMFADIVGFTRLVPLVRPEDLVATLDGLFSQFDDACQILKVEKIKTIGDCYMCASLAPTRDAHPEQAARVLQLASTLHSLVSRWCLAERPLALRAGLHCGPVVAGIIGKLKFCYDMWGDTVNIASRMESHGVANATQVTEQAYALLKDTFVFEARGPLEIKNRGTLFTYLHVIDRVAPPPPLLAEPPALHPHQPPSVEGPESYMQARNFSFSSVREAIAGTVPPAAIPTNPLFHLEGMIVDRQGDLHGGDMPDRREGLSPSRMLRRGSSVRDRRQRTPVPRDGEGGEEDGSLDDAMMSLPKGLMHVMEVPAYAEISAMRWHNGSPLGSPTSQGRKHRPQPTRPTPPPTAGHMQAAHSFYSALARPNSSRRPWAPTSGVAPELAGPPAPMTPPPARPPHVFPRQRTWSPD